MTLAGMENIQPDQQVNPQLAPVSGPDVRYQPPPLQPDEDAAQAAGASALTPAVPLPSGLSPSIADQLSKLGFAQKIAKNADALATVSPNPSAPGAWARSIVGGTQHALAGMGDILKDNAIASGAANAASIPRGAPAFATGFNRTLEAQKKMQQEMQTEAFQKKHAMAQEQIDMMHVDQARRGMAKDDPELAMLDQHVANDQALIKPYTEGGENGEGAAPVLGQHLTQDEVAKQVQEGKLNPTQMHRFADGKVPTGEKDKYGNPVYEQTYTVVGDSPEVTITPEVAARLKAGHVTGADGKEIQAGQVLPGYIYGTVSQKLQNQETANQAVRIARERGDLEELTDKQKIDNQKLINDYGNFYSKAHNDPNTDPEDARMMAYNHMVNDPQYAGQVPQIQNLLFGSPDKADKAMTDFRNRHDRAFLEPLMKDPGDEIGSLTELSKQVGPNGQPTPAAVAANRQLSQFTPQEIETRRKDIASEADKASKQKQQADQTAQGDTDLTGEAYFNSLPKDHQPLVRQIANGQMPLQSIQRILTKQPGLIEEVALYDPQFDGSKIKGYEKVVNDFNSGKTSNQLVAINTLLPHLDTLLTNLNAGFGTTVPGISTLEQKAGNDQAVAVKIARQQATQELAAAYATGAVTDQQHKSFEEELNTSSPYELRKSIKDISELLESKLSALQDKWEEGAPSPRFKPKHPIVSPTAQAALDRIKSDTDHTDYSLTNAQGQKVTYRSLQDMLAAQQAQKTGQMQRQQVNPQTGHLAGNPFATPTPTPQVQQ